MCITLSCSASPKASRLKRACGGRWEKIAGIGSQAATSEHAPQSVPTCPSLPLLQQVWDQHFERIEGRIRWRDGPAVQSAERVTSPYETDARASRKRETEWVGYKVHLTETCGEEEAVHLIVQAEITAATLHDVEETMPLLRDLQARDLVPEVRLVDSGYVSGEVLAQHTGLGIELVGPLKQEGGWQHETGYGVSAFEIDWQKQQVRCPQGQLSQNWCNGHTHGEEVIRVSFSAV